MDVEPIVFVISGDSKVRRNLSLRLKQFGYQWRLCHSPANFQQIASPQDAGCILLNVAQVNIDLVWLTALGPHESHWPVIGIAADADVETAVLAMKRGAFDFLLESCSDERLRAAIDEALHWDGVQRKHIARMQSVRGRLKQLTPPLRDVLDLVLKGRSNREMADELGLAVRTIEFRRSKVMQAMKARTLAALIRQALLVQGVGPSRPRPAAEMAVCVHHAGRDGELDSPASRRYRSRPAK